MSRDAALKRLLEPLEKWLRDDSITEIMWQQPAQIWIECKGVMQLHQADIFNMAYMQMLMRMLAANSLLPINAMSPIASGVFERVRWQAVWPPVARYGALSLRLLRSHYESWQRKGGQVVGVVEKQPDEDFDPRCCSEAKIKQLMRLHKTIVVAGGTSSGKTSCLHYILSLLPKTERLIILEDTPEIFLPNHHCLNLLSRPSSVDWPELSIQNLLQCSLRMRPDRLIMGEIRGAEVIDFLHACSTGHPGSFCTVHANSADEVVARMVQLIKLRGPTAMTDDDLSVQIRAAIDYVIFVRKEGVDRVIESLVAVGEDC